MDFARFLKHSFESFFPFLLYSDPGYLKASHARRTFLLHLTLYYFYLQSNIGLSRLIRIYSRWGVLLESSQISYPSSKRVNLRKKHRENAIPFLFIISFSSQIGSKDRYAMKKDHGKLIWKRNRFLLQKLSIYETRDVSDTFSWGRAVMRMSITYD